MIPKYVLMSELKPRRDLECVNYKYYEGLDGTIHRFDKNIKKRYINVI